MPLHADATKFLEKRKLFRDGLAAALKGTVPASATIKLNVNLVTVVGDHEEASPEEGEGGEEASPEEGEGGEEASPEEDEDSCAVPARVEAASGACSKVAEALANVTRIESFKEDDGWPSAKGLYSELIAMTKRAEKPRPTDTMEQVLQWQRQIDLLESYRKMLLHKKQGGCHFIKSWSESMKADKQSQVELAALLQNQLVGLKPYTEDED